MKKEFTLFCAGIILLGMTTIAQASLTTIGTASYDRGWGITTHNLIYDDDDTGFGGGGLVWLDFKTRDTLGDLRTWAAGIGTKLTINLYPEYTTNIDWTTGWRLPDTPDETQGYSIYGFKGDPDNDGKYDYNYGYNLGDSEMGHLYYEELGNKGFLNIDGSQNYYGNYGLLNTGDFQSLISTWYWSGSTVTNMRYYSTTFIMGTGMQNKYTYGKNDFYGMAVHSGQILQSPVPVPGAVWLLGSGLISFVAFRRKSS